MRLQGQEGTSAMITAITTLMHILTAEPERHAFRHATTILPALKPAELIPAAFTWMLLATSIAIQGMMMRMIAASLSTESAIQFLGTRQEKTASASTAM